MHIVYNMHICSNLSEVILELSNLRVDRRGTQVATIDKLSDEFWADTAIVREVSLVSVGLSLIMHWNVQIRALIEEIM